MLYRLFFLTSLLFSAAVTGCASHSVRPGVWEFTYQIERVQNQTPLPKKAQEVLLEVEWAVDQPQPPTNPQVQEVVLISPRRNRPSLGPEANLPLVGMRPMYAEIEVVGDNRILRVPTHQEKDWVWQLKGEVKNPQYIWGTHFDARIMRVDTAAFEGTWSLQWVRDE